MAISPIKGTYSNDKNKIKNKTKQNLEVYFRGAETMLAYLKGLFYASISS